MPTSMRKCAAKHVVNKYLKINKNKRCANTSLVCQVLLWTTLYSPCQPPCIVERLDRGEDIERNRKCAAVINVVHPKARARELPLDVTVSLWLQQHRILLASRWDNLTHSVVHFTQGWQSKLTWCIVSLCTFYIDRQVENAVKCDKLLIWWQIHPGPAVVQNGRWV